jgi:hypothetical protein
MSWPFIIRKQFQTFESIPLYFRAIATEWMNILFGESLVAVIFLVWWALGSPPLVLIFMLAALVAGYYAWRASYLSRIPQIVIKRFALTETPTVNAGVFYAYVQIVPECVTGVPVHECQGYLLRVLKRSAPTDNWEPTQIDEPLQLLWSIYDDTAPRTLQPGVETRLNLCWISNTDRNLHAAVERLPFRFSRVFNARDTFRFDIRLTPKDCPPADVSVSVRVGSSWNNPSVELISSKQ